MSETRFTSHVSDDMHRIPKYSSLRRDANATGHTGMAVYVHDTNRDFTIRLSGLESVHVESIWLQVKSGSALLFSYLSSTGTLLLVFSGLMNLLSQCTESKTINTHLIFYLEAISI